VRTLFVVSAYAFFFSKQPAHTYKKKKESTSGGSAVKLHGKEGKRKIIN
jgi:hypothetical protein